MEEFNTSTSNRYPPRSNRPSSFQSGFGKDIEQHVPPHSLEGERSVLGALLIDPNAFHKVIDVGLQQTDFYKEAHGKVFQTIQELISKSEPVDLITLTAALKNREIYELVGGSAFLTGLFDNSYSSANVVHYAKIVKEKATLRRMIGAVSQIAENAYGGVENVEEFLDEAEKLIFEVTDSKLRQTFLPIGQILMTNMATLNALGEQKTGVTGLPTGFTDLDEKTSGLHPGNLLIIAGRPAMGKTSFVMNIAERSALRAQASVAIFSLEMAREELGMRLLSGVARIDASRLKTGRLSEIDWKNLSKASQQLSASKIFIDDTPAITVLEMRARCRRLQAEHGLHLVIVDYLQLMRGSSKGGKGGADSREREISEISRSLKALAKELRVPVIALSQLNRGVESRPDKRPMLSDLRESGAIEQDADIVAFVYRDEVYNKESEDRGVAEIILAKHRAGGVGTVRLKWIAECTAFDNLAPDYRNNDFPMGGGGSLPGAGGGMPSGLGGDFGGPPPGIMGSKGSTLASGRPTDARPDYSAQPYPKPQNSPRHESGSSTTQGGVILPDF